MAVGTREVSKGIGPTFGDDLVDQGLGGKKITWRSAGPNSMVYFYYAYSPTQEELDDGWIYYSSASNPDIADLDAAIAAHNPSAAWEPSDNDALINGTIAEAVRLRAFPAQTRHIEGYTNLLSALVVLMEGGVE